MRKALVIGINDYPNAPLLGSVNDAEAIAKALATHEDERRNFGVKKIIAPSEKITRALLRQNIEELFSGDPEIALLFFSGHGHIKSTGGYIVTPDFVKYDEGVSMNEIFELANISRATNKVIILDCCHSGAFGTPNIPNGTSPLSEGLSVLTACRATEIAYEENGHGVFTKLVLSGLNGGAADLRGHVTPGSVYAYVDQAMGEWEHRPIFKTNVTKFCSLREVKPRVSTEMLKKLIVHFPDPTAVFKLDPTYEDTEPTKNSANCNTFKELQKFAGVGLVMPVDEEHMYYAAINSTGCKLTSYGEHYWTLANKGLI